MPASPDNESRERSFAAAIAAGTTLGVGIGYLLFAKELNPNAFYANVGVILSGVIFLVETYRQDRNFRKSKPPASS